MDSEDGRGWTLKITTDPWSDGRDSVGGGLGTPGLLFGRPGQDHLREVPGACGRSPGESPDP